jgi:hypothetical protein
VGAVVTVVMVGSLIMYRTNEVETRKNGTRNENVVSGVS